MYSKEKLAVLEKTFEENALCMDYALDTYSYRSSASRAIKDLEETGLLEEVPPPPISPYNKMWILTEKAKAILDIE